MFWDWEFERIKDYTMSVKLNFLAYEIYQRLKKRRQ